MNPFDFLAIKALSENDPHGEVKTMRRASVKIAGQPFWHGGYAAGVRFAMAYNFIEGAAVDVNAFRKTIYAEEIPELDEFFRGVREYFSS